MKSSLNIFLNKKILVYGLGKSVLSNFNFLKKKSKVFTYDDNKKSLISYQDLKKIKFDYIIISPGINIKKCKLSKFLKTYSKKIFTDLDVFFSFFKNDCITVTGTNGKSTTCQLLYEILLKQKFDVRLVGNIGNPILSSIKIKPKTIFVVEASSYQLEYSKIFKSKFAVLLNITPDHIERHRTIKRYVSAKFKLIKNQSKQCLCFLKKGDFLIEKELKVTKIKSKIIKVDTLKYNKILYYLKNEYFLTEANKENLLFVLAIADKLKLNKKLLFDTIQNFKGLKYRQQIVHKKSNLIIINDSKSTSFSSSLGILKTNSNIYWLLGGINKKSDKFNLPKKYHYNIKAFIFGKKRNFFNNQLKGKIQTENFHNLKDAFKKVVNLTKRQRSIKKTILFSPSAASFDSFKNFEDRGQYFNKLIKKYLNE
jgi:UDP-N-acetylmuramoylalanine--D-glutamate ligase